MISVTADCIRSQNPLSRELIPFFWTVGLFSGILTGMLAEDLFFSLMRRFLTAPVSIVSMLATSALPFLMTVLSVFLYKPGWLLVACYGKAFLFALFSFSVLMAFPLSGWLIRWLLLFREFFCLPLLYFCLIRFSGPARPCSCELTCLLSLAALIISFDYSIVLPFWASLIEK